MTTVRIITKYPNRRLYDSEESRYITLTDIRDLVLEGVEIAVIEKRSGDDITQPILLQVISDMDQRYSAIISADFLAQVIRCRDKIRPELVGDQLYQCLRNLIARTQNLATNESNTNFNAHSKKTLTSGP